MIRRAISLQPQDSTLALLGQDLIQHNLQGHLQLNRLMKWFQENHIEVGDPTSLEQDCAREAKARVFEAVDSQNNFDFCRKPSRLQSRRSIIGLKVQTH